MSRLGRLTCLAIAIGCSILPSRFAIAAEAGIFGDKSLRLIVGMPPGGGVDTYARLVQRHLPKYLPGSPPIVVQNMPGAGSLRSVIALANSWQDETTSIATFSSSLIADAITDPDRVKVDFRSFAFLANVAEDSRVCFVRANSGIRTLDELFDRKALNFGATAPGTSGNVDTAMLKNLFQIRINPVLGYAGSADKRLALERGEIDGDCAGVTSLPDVWLKERRINILVRFSPTLTPGLDPNVPFGGDFLKNDARRRIYDFLVTPQQLGRVFIASRKISAERIAALRQGFDATLKDPEFLAEAGKMGLLITPTPGAVVDRRIAELYETPTELLKEAKAITGE